MSSLTQNLRHAELLIEEIREAQFRKSWRAAKRAADMLHVVALEIGFEVGLKAEKQEAE